MGLHNIWTSPDRLFLGIIENVDYANGICSISFFHPNDKVSNIVTAQPYAGRGWGIFTGVEPGTICICALDQNGKIYIVGFLPDPVWLREDLYNIPRIGMNEFNYPQVNLGEIALQGKKNNRVVLDRFGSIALLTPSGSSLTIDNDTDTISEITSQRYHICEAFRSISGVIKRDIRSREDRLKEPFVGSSSAYDLNINEANELIGFNPAYKPNAAPALDDSLLGSQVDSGVKQDIQKSFSSLPKGLVDLSLGITGPFNYQSDAVNPALAETNFTFYEFGDSNIGLDIQKVPDSKKALGLFDDNVLGKLIIGTAVNELGRIQRFDYGFLDGLMGHQKMWNTQKVHGTGLSTDDCFDSKNVLGSGVAAERENFEWIVDSLDKVDTATMVDLTFRTRGMNYKQKVEGEPSAEGGVKWFLKIAKDGLTKLQIPAATSLNGKEFYREGRSIIGNINGSVELTIGKQLCTKDKGLDRITGVTDTRANFVNMNNYPNYGRKDRSIALDLLGNLEALIGGDSNTNQSVMLQADGSLSAFFGKEIVTGATGASSTVATDSSKPISTACFATDRKDRSISIRTLGNAEMHFNKDTKYQQSLMVTAEGGSRLMLGKDYRNRSLDVASTGGIRIEVQGAMLTQGYALELDLEGHLHIFANGKIDIHSTGDMKLQTEKNFHLDVGGNFYGQIKGNQNWICGGNKISSTTGNDINTVAGGYSMTATSFCVLQSAATIGLISSQAMSIQSSGLAFITPKLDLTSSQDITLTASRNIILQATGNMYETVKGNKQSTISSNSYETIGGNKSSSITGNQIVNVTGNYSETIKGSFNSLSTVVSLTSSGAFNLVGTSLGLGGGNSIVSSVAPTSFTVGPVPVAVSLPAPTPLSFTPPTANTAVPIPNAVSAIPVTPQPMFTSSRERVQVLVGTDSSQTVPTATISDKSGKPAVTKKLEEVLDKQTELLTNPFAKE